MKKLILGLILGLMILPGVALADVPNPNTKSIEYCFKVVNVNDFPDYTLLKTEWLGSLTEAKQVKQNECYTTGYKFNQVILYAVKNEDFNSSLLEDLSEASRWLETSGKARPAMVYPVNFVDLNSVVTKIEDVINIENLNSNKFIINTDRMELTANGDRFNQPENDLSGTNLPGVDAGLNWLYWVIGILLVLIVGAVVLLFGGFSKDKNNI